MIEQSDHPIGALLLTFGSPATLEDVPAYMARVRGAKDVPADLVAEFRRRYEVVGGSPLIAITEQQADALAAELRRRYPSGPQFRVGIGMRHSPPYIEDAIGELAAAGVSEIAAVIMSPQYSPSIMGGYHRAVEAGIAAAVAAGYAVTANVAGAWNLNPHFLDALAERLREALSALPPEVRDTAPVLLTCHSLPKRVVEKEPGYLTQIDQTVIAIVERVGLAANRWQFAYQSAGHTPEEWLTPDMKDLLPGLRARGHHHVVMVPVQFLADHLEILYDIDVAAREDAERQGITLHRIESLNLSPSFIAALADVVEETSPSLVELAVDQAKR